MQPHTQRIPINLIMTKSFPSEIYFFHENSDWESLNSEFAQYDWEAEFQGCDVNEMFNKFLKTTLEISRKHVPLRKPKGNKLSKIPKERRIIMRKRRRIQNQMNKTTSGARKEALMRRLVEIEKQLQRSHGNQQEEQENNAVNKIRSNSKYFYSYAKSFSSIKVGIGPLINSAKQIIADPFQMASILSNQYSSVFSSPKYTR